MASWFVDPLKDKVMEKIIDAGFEYLKDQVRWQTGMKEELLSLLDLHPKIQAVVFAANQQQIGDQNSEFSKWLWQLRDAIDEADDVLDEFEYLKYKELFARNKEKTKELHCTSFLIEGARKFFERALKIDPNLKRLEAAVHKLVNVSKGVSDFLSLFKIEIQEQQKWQQELNDIRETGALPTNNFIGRCEEMEFIMQWLSNSSSNEDQSHITSANRYKNISLLSIVGHGGMGKTTLSQHAYDNEMTKFDVKMWVCVSTNFNVKRVIAGMLESHKKSKCDLGTLEGLQKRLQSVVDSKKFLLVLDDIWEDENDTSKWENVFGPLAYGSLGSKILLTTRMESVASKITDVLSSNDHKILRLGPMKEDDCLQILNSAVFGTVENSDAQKNSILVQIVKKVLGSPLAAKVIGGGPRDTMIESYWKIILNSNIGSIEQSQPMFFPILRLSYIFLPKPLQSCFSFCSMFPQYHMFDKDDLIRMWIALNFIQQSSNPSETLEDIGERYFDTLFKKSFFEKFQYHDGTFYYKMHDLLHELAQFVSSGECCRVEYGEELSVCETIRHLSVKTDDLEVFREIKKFKKLRSLFLSYDKVNHKDFADVLSEIFKASSSIRLLFINGKYQMLEAIGYLRHLRYLKCDKLYNFTQLPRSICNLYHMYFIIYGSSWAKMHPKCDIVPKDMNNLFNLRYVELPWKRLRKTHFIGRLHPLQKLNSFLVKNEAGYRINELEHMNELCKLRIYQLENVKDVEEACSAKLCDKRSLTKLSLHWVDLSLQWGGYKYHRKFVDSNLEEKVLDNLQPHNNNLKRLTIKAYMGIRSAIWMNDVNFISKLEHIKLEGCLEWQILPPFGQLRFLKFLYLRKMPKAKSIDYGFHRNDEDCAFPSLKVLHIEDLDALEDWFDAAAVTANDSLFPCLTELYLKRCPNLQVLPSLPPKLQRLEMVDIRWKGFSWPQDTCYEVNITRCGDFPTIFYHYKTTQNGQSIVSDLYICDPLRSITSARDLKIYDNDKLVSFPIETEEFFRQVSSSLSELSFEDLKSLQSLPSFLKSFSSLKNLKLSYIPLLKSLPDFPPSLEELSIYDLESLECLPSSLSTFSSLKNLELRTIPLLKSLPDLPPSLTDLSIDNLKSLECLPSSLSTISSLKELWIWNVPLLKQLPDIPSSLQSLSIAGCHKELKKRYDKISGFDRDKLAHIPYVCIE